MSKIQVVEQMEHSECGLACVGMLINYFQCHVTLSELRDKFGVPNGGFNILQLKEILKQYNIQSKGVKILNIQKLNNELLPIISFWENKHFVIIEKVGRKVRIIDPASGRRVISQEEFQSKSSDFFLIPENQKKEKRKKKDNEIAFILTGILKKNKKKVFFLFFFTFLLQVLSLTIPLSIQRIIDNTLHLRNTNTVYVLISLVFISFYFTNFIKTILETRFQIEFDKDLMSKTIIHLLELPISFFSNRNKGELIYRINSNTYIRQILTERIISTFIDLMFCFVYIFVMISISFKLTMAIFFISSFLLIVSILYTKKIKVIQQDEIIISARNQNLINELIQNVVTIKSIDSKNVIYDKWYLSFLKQMKFEKKKSLVNAIFGNAIATIQIIIPGMIYAIGNIYIFRNELSIGTLIAFNTISGYFISPVISLVSSYNDIMIIKVFLDKLLDIFSSEIEDETLPKGFLNNGSVNLKNVSFKYNYFSKNILNDISIKVNGNEKIAVVGKSGSGKSTLLQLISGLLESNDGQIQVGDLFLSEINKFFYREQIGVVIQQANVFNGSIKENILMGRNVSQAQFDEVVKALNIEDITCGSSAGMNTIISEEGGNISGGQKQRITLARALVNTPKILLMDEPTSSLDNEAEQSFLKYIFQLNCTCLMVAHRFSNIELFDKILVLDEGKVVGYGKHQNLIGSCNEYKKLYDSQGSK